MNFARMLNESILSDIAPLTEGLLYISESESPIDLFTLDNVTGDLKGILAARTQLTAADTEERPVAAFFDTIERQADPADDYMMALAEKYRTLKAFLENNFKQLQFFRAGKKQIQLYITATNDNSSFLVLHMVSIET